MRLQTHGCRKCTAIGLDLVYLYFSLAGILDSVESIAFEIGNNWNIPLKR